MSSLALRVFVLLVAVVIMSGASCVPRPTPSSNNGTSYVVRFESSSKFLRVDASGIGFGASDSGASFVLFDLNRGELLSGDEVLLLSALDSYVAGGGPGATVSVRNSGPSAPGSSQIGFCNTIVQIEAAGSGEGVLRDGASVTLRVFPDPCSAPGTRSAGGFVSLVASGAPPIVAAPASANETSILHIDRAEPYSITRNISAPFATTNRFNAGNLMDLDWHKSVSRDYLGASPGRTYDDHTGIDFGWPWPGFRAMREGGAAVLAVAAGKVVYVRQDREDRCHSGDTPGCPPDVPHDTDKAENEVIIQHDDGTVSVYAHLMKNSVPVAEGDRVECGQFIARVGSSGGSSAPHLHFELRRVHDPDFWTKNTGFAKFPHFWDHSMIIDPYQIGAWKEFGNTAPWTDPDKRDIPLVTCDTNDNRRLAREGEDNYWRSQLAKGHLFDSCGSEQSKCGQDYWCGPKGYCEPRVNAGEACTSGNQCPALHGCQNGTCRVGLNCTDQCPVAPHPYNCFIDASQSCMHEVSRTVRDNCSLVAGVCVWPCFTDGDGNCNIDHPKTVRESCNLVCLP